MKKALMILAFVIAGSVFCNAQRTVIYVAPEGNDEANDGSIRTPFASFNKAVAAVKERSGKGTDTIYVYFRGGEYRLSEVVNIEGIKDNPVVFSSYPGEEAVFSGSISLDKWKRYDKYLVEMDLKGIELGDPITKGKRPMLYYKGEEQKLARWPEEGFATAGRALGATEIPPVENGNSGAVEGIFEYKDARIDRWAKEKDPKVGGYWFYDWDHSYCSVTAIDPVMKSISVDTDKWFRHGLRFYGLNLFCELDTPGEWYIDREKSKIYWYPLMDADPLKNPDGLTLSVLDAAYMLELKDCNDVTIENLSFSQSRGSAIRISGGNDCVVRDCVIENMGVSAIDVKMGTAHKIQSCVIRHLGGGGIHLEGGDRKELEYCNFEVSNNLIEDFSRFSRVYCPGIGCVCCGIHIHHNELRFAPSSAFSLSGNDVVAEFNLIEKVAQESDDQGAYDLYLNPSMRGIKLRYNYWKDIVGGTRYGVGGIRLDDLISGIEITGNVFDNCGSVEFGAVQIHGGSENFIEDNLFYKCKYAVSFTRYGEKKWTQTYNSIHKILFEEVNIHSDKYLIRYPEIRELGKNIDVNIIRNNVVFGCGQKFFNDGGRQIVSNNVEIADDGRTVEQLCDRKTLHAMGIKYIPLEEMGIKENRLIKEQVKVEDLTVEMREDPEGIDIMTPRLSWKVCDETLGSEQKSYRIQVASSEINLLNSKDLVWDSGKVESSESVLVPYGGDALDFDKDYYWRVKVTAAGGESSWSQVAHWSTGLKDTTQWCGARWIGIDESEKLRQDENRLAAHYLRKEFRLKGDVERAKLYFCALGMGIVTINGEKPCKDVFAHPPVLFNKTEYYRCYDVTDFVNKGKNTIGVVLGNGRYQHLDCMTLRGVANPMLYLCMKVTYRNGKEEVIISDESWMGTSRGPVTNNNEFDGEDYDARLELGAWDRNGYKCSEIWKAVDMMKPNKGKLVAMPMDDMAICEEVPAKKLIVSDDGRYIIDMGQNMVGYVSVSLCGKAGKSVTIRYAEKLNAAGDSLDMSNLRAAKATDHYIPAKDGRFRWSPVFPYHGFRYVEVTGVTEAPEAADITGKVVADKMEVLGSFKCSDERLNKLYRNMFWTIRSDYRGMPIDCPQRDERQGWLGDRAATLYGECYMFQTASLYRKWMDDIYDSMKKECRISVVSPKNWSIYNDDTAASAVFVYIADMLYTRFGDDSGIKIYYPAMKRWFDYITGKYLHDGIYTMKYDEYKDWCVPPESLEIIHSQDSTRITSSELIHTGVLCDVIVKMKKFAALTGNDADIPAYDSMLAEVKGAYNKKFFDEKTARYDNNTMTANLIPLAMDIVPQGRASDVVANVVDVAENIYGGHLCCGNVGIRYLMQTLTRNGQLEYAYKLATQDTYPGWGYMISKGATTIWELWNGDFADPAMNSENHVMMIGDLLSWYYENLAGIRNDDVDVAFRKILLMPSFPSELKWVDASYKTPYGVVRSAWDLDYEEEYIKWEITVPTGATATAVVPASFNVDTEGFEFTVEGDVVKVNIPSGKHNLKTK